MGNLVLHFIFITIFLVATTNTCLDARNTTTACFEHEQLALLKFKHSVRDSYGMLSSWDGNDCCRWERVMCDGVTGNVESLHLRGNHDLIFIELLYGEELNTSIGELRHLKYLDLSNNYFQGQIPEFIGSLKQLTYLNLSYAYFSGIIPHHIGNLSNLKNLDLSADKFSRGLIAHDMTWISGLSSLEYLDLSYANLSGAKNLDLVLYIIPSLKEIRLKYCNLTLSHTPHNLTTLSNVQHLDLSNNQLMGSIAESLGKARFLQVLDLSCNMLTGPIPVFTGKLTKLDLSYNHLNGSIPESFGRLRLLQVLKLSHNELTGPIPTFNIMLTKLDLSYNHLNGSIPESFGSLATLTSLSLENNKLTGPIPTSLGRLVSLESFSTSSNFLSGTIPVSIGKLSKLGSLDVSHNSLEGVVSEAHFANLSMLKYLNTASNTKLIFNVTHEWLPPFQLITVDLTSCKITNGFPQWLRNQRELISLVLSNATISGPLPIWLRKMPIIPFINLSHNRLSGPLTNLPSEGTYDGEELKGLFLQNNLFNESIPKSLCTRTDLEYLNLSRNRLTGKIPNCFQDMQNLLVIMLSSNGLSGSIPSFIGSIYELVLLNLNDNNFSGKLPTELWNLDELGILDLGDNAFSGKIPEWIGEKVASLVVFRIHGNKFTGGIPRSLCKNLKLQILDVAHNNLTGIIPRCLGELFVMAHSLDVYRPEESELTLIQVLNGVPLEFTKTLQFVINMDLSSNKLVGEIPVELTALQELVGLNLSNNHLNGGIPNNIGNMTALSSLDLSRNKLNGSIPSSIAALTFLSHLNLSNNNLSGRIPTGNQLQTLIDPSIYAGNKDLYGTPLGLCGAPFPKNLSNHEDPTATPKNYKYEATDEPNKVWFYVDIVCGFAAGFWGVIVVLMWKKQWRHKLFMFAEGTMDKIHVAVMVRVNKKKRGREDL